MENNLLRVHEAAHLLNVSRWTIYRWVEEGRLEATKIGRGSLRIFHQSVSGLVEQNRTVHFEAMSLGARKPDRRAVATGGRKS